LEKAFLKKYLFQTAKQKLDDYMNPEEPLFEITDKCVSIFLNHYLTLVQNDETLWEDAFEQFYHDYLYKDWPKHNNII